MTTSESERYTYTHAGECGGTLTKPPTGKSGVVYNGLHGWECTSCGERGVKVNRTLRGKKRATSEVG